MRIVKGEDGWYLMNCDGENEAGPFDSRKEAEEYRGREVLFFV